MTRQDFARDLIGHFTGGVLLVEPRARVEWKRQGETILRVRVETPGYGAEVWVWGWHWDAADFETRLSPADFARLQLDRYFCARNVAGCAATSPPSCRHKWEQSSIGYYCTICGQEGRAG